MSKGQRNDTEGTTTNVCGGQRRDTEDKDGATKGQKSSQRRDNDETIKGRQTDDGWTETAHYRDDNDTTDVQRRDRERTVNGRRRRSDGASGALQMHVEWDNEWTSK